MFQRNISGKGLLFSGFEFPLIDSRSFVEKPVSIPKQFTIKVPLGDPNLQCDPILGAITMHLRFSTKQETNCH